MIGCGMLGMGENWAAAGHASASARSRANSLKFRRISALRLIFQLRGASNKGAEAAGSNSSCLILLGERDGTRTHDLLIKSQMLYRLSYALPS